MGLLHKKRNIIMVKTASTMLPLGSQAPDFNLLSPAENKLVSLSDYTAKPLLVIFMCNHCPFVIHLRDALVKFTKEFMGQGLAVVAISSNDISSYPQDGPDLMARDAKEYGYPFSYLFDETQQVAKEYHAACTPDFFLFDAEHKLVYRGQFDASRPGNQVAITGSDLRKAVESILSGQPVSSEQRPSIGCNIKWKMGHEPAYFTGQSAE
jgi:peroxiredoxin